MKEVPAMAPVDVKQTIIGTIGSIYELRRVGKDNRAVIDFSVAVTPRVRDGEDWKDGDTIWTSVTAWGTLAENIEKSFKKGHRVFLVGSTRMKPGYTNKEGVEVEARPFLLADYAGLEVTYDSAESSRKPRESGSSNSSRSATPAKQTRKAAKPVEDLDDDIFGSDDFDDEPPF